MCIAANQHRWQLRTWYYHVMLQYIENDVCLAVYDMQRSWTSVVGAGVLKECLLSVTVHLKLLEKQNSLWHFSESDQFAYCCLPHMSIMSWYGVHRSVWARSSHAGIQQHSRSMVIRALKISLWCNLRRDDVVEGFVDQDSELKFHPLSNWYSHCSCC